MSEETAVAESVTSTEVPVALDPALLNKPVRPEEQVATGSADAELLRTKLGLANSHAKQAKKDADNRALQTMFSLLATLVSLRSNPPTKDDP